MLSPTHDLKAPVSHHYARRNRGSSGDRDRLQDIAGARGFNTCGHGGRPLVDQHSFLLDDLRNYSRQKKRCLGTDSDCNKVRNFSVSCLLYLGLCGRGARGCGRNFRISAYSNASPTSQAVHIQLGEKWAILIG